MKTLKPSLLILAFVLLLEAGPADAQNLATNPGFETGNTTGWSTFGGSPTISATTAQVHSGTYAGLVTNRTATYIGIAQSFSGVLVAGQTYNISAWVRLAAGPDQTVQLTMQQVDDSGTVYSLIASGSASTSGWTQISGQFTFNYSGTLISLVMYAEVPSSATAAYYIDDLSVQSTSVLPANGQCTVDWSTVFQHIDGFGASSAYGGNWTTAQEDMFYSTNSGNGTSLDGHVNFSFKGIGLSLLRNHITLASSAAPTATPTTVETSIMQYAQAHGARVWSTPWSPAVGFKSTNDIYDSLPITNSVNGGTYLGSGNNATNVAYASQLANYVLNMKTNYGVNLYAISVQNEPDASVNTYDACQWTGAQIHDFATNLYSALAAKGVGSTKIILPESQNWADYHGFAATTMSDPNAATDIGIIADHNYDGANGPASLAKNSYGKALWETEVSTFDDFDGSITNAVYWAGRIHLFMTAAQVNAWHFWWLIPYGADNEGLTDANGVPAKRMYALGQFARFVRPDYYRINVTNNTGSALVSAYRDSLSPNFAIVAINASSLIVTQAFNLANVASITNVTPWITSGTMSLSNQTPVAVSGSSFSYALPAWSVVTFVGQAPNMPVVTNADSGPGSLRNAVATASVGSTIVFDPSLSGQTITLTSGQIELSNSVTIDGSALANGIQINGNANDRIFQVDGGATVVLNSLNIINGQSGAPGGGGGIYNADNGNLTMTRCTMSGNADFGYGGGGGIYNDGFLTVNECTFWNNTSGDIYFGGGGIVNDNEGTLVVNQSTLVGNSALSQAGGGIFSTTANVFITNTIVAGNSAASGPTNLYVGSGTYSGLANLTNGDPMLYPLGNYGGPTLTMPPSPGSPAIDAGNDAAASQFTTDQRGAGFARIAGAQVDIGAVELQMAAPAATTLAATGIGFTNATLNASIAPNGTDTTVYFEYGLTTSYGSLTAVSNVSGTYGLVSFSANLTGLSPGTPNHFRAVTGNSFGTNFGADLIFSTSAIRIVTNTNDDDSPGSLRSVVADSSSGDLITFDPSLAGQTILLTNGLIELDSSVTIDGSSLTNGIQINGNNASPVFVVDNNASVVLNNLTVTNGYDTNGIAGGIANYATLTLNRCSIVGNVETGWGGAFWNDGILTLNNCTVANNTAQIGAGVDNDYDHILIVNQCTFTGNTSQYGAAIDNNSMLTVNQSTISGNTATSFAGGIFNYYGATLNLTNSIVAGNAGTDLGNFQTLNASAFNLIGGVPQLAPLGNYGGPTQTMPPLPGSPAIDAGTDSVTNFLATDQRGFARLVGAHVDIGAVEGVYVANFAGPGLLNNTMRLNNGAGAFQFGFTNYPDLNTSFTVWASTNLALPFNQWSNLGAVVDSPPGSGLYQFTDPGATNSPQRFYEVVSP